MNSKKHLRIDQDDYIRPEITKQDIISSDKEQIKKKLEGWILVPEDYTYRIDCGIWIKYINKNGSFRNGGILIKNSSPEYFVLKNPIKNISWSVHLKENHIFIEDEEEKEKEKKMKQVLYDLWKSGDIEIHN
jgi:hypothetical protein